MRVQTLTLVPTMVAVAAVIGIAACSKQIEERSVGQQVDSAVAKVERKTDQAVAAVKSGVGAAENAGSKVVDATKEKVKDATITTSIKAELARDASLSALKIDVDTSAGRVALKGTAPDASARDRATLLAQRVDGVVGVDNRLEIRRN